MSNDESAKSSYGEKYLTELADRLGEQSAAWGLPRLVGLDHLNRSLASARSRVNDSHRMQMAQLKNVTGVDYGVDDPDEDMAGINVQGDTHVNIVGGESPLKKLLPIALACALGAAGVYYCLNPTPIMQTYNPANWQLSVEVSDEP